MVKLLVKAHALVDKANQKGTTALMRATQEGNEEVVGILVSAGADVSKRNNERMNALMLGSQVIRPLLCFVILCFLAQSSGAVWYRQPRRYEILHSNTKYNSHDQPDDSIVAILCLAPISSM